MVLPSGPPSVMSLMVSNTRMEPIIVTIEAMSTVGISSGSLILRNSAKLLAPSMRAASTISPGRFMTAP